MEYEFSTVNYTRGKNQATDALSWLPEDRAGGSYNNDNHPIIDVSKLLSQRLNKAINGTCKLPHTEIYDSDIRTLNKVLNLHYKDTFSE